MAKQPSKKDHDRQLASQAERDRAKSISGREIGDIPTVKDHKRKRRAWNSLQFFYEAYFPKKFNLGWSADHLRVIALLEETVEYGGQFALAMPRASGKTTISERAMIWALCTGRKRFGFLIGSSEMHADGCLDNIKMELGYNELLLEDWPEVCYPIKCLEGEARRANGQLHHGRKTNIGWGASELILPTIPGSPASGSLVRVAGITGNIRGALHAIESGESLRPDFVILDDPQTDDSAKSESQNTQRESIIDGAVLGLAGPDKAISAIMPCTVIKAGDMVDKILDRTIHPEWRGERTKMVLAWPERQDLWDRYKEIRAESMRAGGKGEEATEFYRENREEMDRGAVVSWPDRFKPGEISAIQSAYNLKLRNPESFEAEYQNAPVIADEMAGKLTAAEVLEKLNQLAKGDVPENAAHITAFIDVHLNLLYWVVVAWCEDFSGAVIDYGAWPEQTTREFTLKDAKVTLRDLAPGAAKEAAIYKGITTLISHLNAQTWIREDGAPMQLAQGLIDANWGDSTDFVYDACKKYGNGKWFPSHGKGVTASGNPIDAAKPKPGERIGQGWRIPSLADSPRKFRHVVFDANFWKTNVVTRWRTKQKDPGSLDLYGDNPNWHRAFIEHITAEYSIETEGRGRRVDEWFLPPARPDNHWGDGVVGNAVAASILGVKLMDIAAPHENKRRRVSFHDRHKPSNN